MRLTRPNVTLAAEPETITPGNSSFLTWNANDSSYCTIEPGLGTFGTSGSVSVSPLETTTYTVTAIDSHGNVSSAGTTITVGSSNETPVANPDSYTTFEDTSLIINDLMANDTDAENDPLSFSSTTQPGNGTLTDNLNGSYTYNPNGDYNGQDSFEYTIFDGFSNSTSATVTITVQSVNDAPIADAGLDQAVSRLDLVELNGAQSSDTEDSSLSFQWTFYAKPQGSNVVIASANLQMASFVPDIVGEYVIDLTVYDGDLYSTEDTLVVTVSPRSIAVPDLQGMTQAQAESAITTAGLALGSISTKYNNTVPAGLVMNQIPSASTTAEEFSSVSIIISLGPTPYPTGNITAEPAIIALGQQATLEWITTNSDAVSIEPGIGDVPLNGVLIVSPSETTTYTMTAQSPLGEVSASVTVTVLTPSSLEVQIESPFDGTLVDSDKVIVKGSVVTIADDYGVVVNGYPSVISGNQFVSNDIPLTEGENTIVATIYDSRGNTASDSIVIHVPIGLSEDSIKIISNINAGLTPLKIQLNINGSVDITGHSLTHAGPGEVEYLENSDENEYTVNLVTPGIYYFTADVTEGATTHSDTVAVAVMTLEEILVPIQKKWDGMKEVLLSGNIETALTYFVELNREKYRAVFTGMTSEKINRLLSTVNSVGLNGFTDHLAYCGVIREEAGGAFSYPVTFVKDEHGIWKIIDM